MTDYVSIAAIILVPFLLCLFAYKRNLLTSDGTVTAFILTEIIGFATNLWWACTFFLFPIIAFIATKWKIKEKVRRGLQEGKKGERNTLNILGVGLIPTVIALVYCFEGSHSICLEAAFLSSLAVSCSDTVASETGIWAKKTYMITTLKEIEPGPNGGVSLYGFATSFIGAMVFAAVGYGLVIGYSYDVWDCMKFILVVLAGMFGNVMDSVFGALLENKGYLSKYTNNASTALIGAIVGFLLFLIF